MATYHSNIFSNLADTEGDPEVEVKEAPKKQETAKAAAQKAPAKKDSGPQKQPVKSQQPPPKAQIKKPENQPNTGAHNKAGGEKPAQRSNQGQNNKSQPANTTFNPKPQPTAATVAPTVTDTTADLETVDKHNMRQKGTSFESIKRDRKSHSGYDTGMKKGGEGRNNWGGPLREGGGEYRGPRKSRRPDNLTGEEAVTAEESVEPTKEGEVAPTEENDPKAGPKAEPQKKSLDEYYLEQNKVKLEMKLPEIRKADEWKGEKPTFVLDKKKDDVYIQVTETEQKKAATTTAAATTTTTTAAPQSPSTEKDTKNKKGVALEISLPRLRKQNKNFDDYNENPAPKKGSFKKDSTSFNIKNEDFPKLQTSA